MKHLIIETQFSMNRFSLLHYFQGYGKADHAETKRLLLSKYSNYEIEISDEGY